MNLFCVMPAYNEEKNIVRVVRGVLGYVDKVIVVNDASLDETSNALKMANFDERVVVLEHVVNRGQGASLQTGNEFALKEGADVIVHFDADGQFLANEIRDLLKPIVDNEVDVVFGSRFLDKKSNIPFWKQNLILPIGRLVNRVVLGKNDLTDPQSGFRAMRAAVASSIVIEQDRMAHCSEILAKVIKSDYRLCEVPMRVIYDDFGQSFFGGINIVKDMIINRLK